MIIIEEKNAVRFKLTVAKDRIAIKVPISSTKEEREEVIPFLEKVASQIGIPDFTLRGKYNSKDKFIIMTTRSPLPIFKLSKKFELSTLQH